MSYSSVVHSNYRNIASYALQKATFLVLKAPIMTAADGINKHFFIAFQRK